MLDTKSALVVLSKSDFTATFIAAIPVETHGMFVTIVIARSTFIDVCLKNKYNNANQNKKKKKRKKKKKKKRKKKKKEEEEEKKKKKKEKKKKKKKKKKKI